MSTIINKSLILSKIKSHYNFSTDAEFARFLDIKPQTLASWYSRNTFDASLLYAKCNEISGGFILSGLGNLLRGPKIQIHDNNRKTRDKLIDSQEVPLYDLEATAGLVEIFKHQGTILDTIKIPNAPKTDGALHITGDSMYPLLKSGDIVMYKEIPVDIDRIFFGEMYLLGVQLDETEEMITAKYVQRSEKGDTHIKLVSQNHHHQPKDIPLAMVTAMAMIKISIRINTMF